MAGSLIIPTSNVTTIRPQATTSKLTLFDSLKLSLVQALSMPERTSSRKSSTIVSRDQLSKLKSRFLHPRPRASTSRSPPIPFNSHPPHVQIHSQLLNNLPLEIRRQIYDHVLSSYGKVQHILLSNNRLTHMRCASPNSHVYFKPLQQHFRNKACMEYDADHRESVQNGWEIVPLLLSCRQTYLEFIEIIYSSTIFRLPINVAVPFISTVPAAHLGLAQLHLCLYLANPMYLPTHAWPPNFPVANANPKADEEEWESCWRAFASLRVRTLLVEIFDDGVRVPEEELLGPLRKVKAGQFEVVLPWPTGLETNGEFEEANFKLRRPPDGKLMVHWDVAKGNPGLGNPKGFWSRLRRR